MQPRETVEKELHGIDKDLREKMNSKMDLDSETVTEAMAWLEKVSGESTKGDFWEVLKSGVVLCKAMNALRPQQPLVERINTKPIALLERENIELYLKACTKLGMPANDLFRINDLYEKQYLPAVLHNVVALARLADARKLLGDKGPQLKAKHRRTQSRAALWSETEPPNPSLAAAGTAQQLQAQARARSASGPPAVDPAPPALAPAPVLQPKQPPAEAALEALVREAGQWAGLHSFEVESDRATLRSAGVKSVAELRALRADEKRWAELRLPLVSRAALERALAHQRSWPRLLLLAGSLAVLSAAGWHWRARWLPSLQARLRT